MTLAKHSERAYSRETLRENQYDLTISLPEMVRAHEDSKRKGGLVAAAMKRKDAAEDGTNFSKKLPGWIRVGKDA